MKVNDIGESMCIMEQTDPNSVGLASGLYKGSNMAIVYSSLEVDKF